MITRWSFNISMKKLHEQIFEDQSSIVSTFRLEHWIENWSSSFKMIKHSNFIDRGLRMKFRYLNNHRSIYNYPAINLHFRWQQKWSFTHFCWKLVFQWLNYSHYIIDWKISESTFVNFLFFFVLFSSDHEAWSWNILRTKFKSKW